MSRAILLSGTWRATEDAWRSLAAPDKPWPAAPRPSDFSAPLESAINLRALEVLRRTGPLVHLSNGTRSIISSCPPPPAWSRYTPRERRLWRLVARLTGVAMLVLAVLAFISLRRARITPQEPVSAPPAASMAPAPAPSTRFTVGADVRAGSSLRAQLRVKRHHLRGKKHAHAARRHAVTR
jgi:hypothetical protein